MDNSSSSSPKTASKTQAAILGRLLVRLLLLFVILLGLLSLAAGRLDWIQAWAFSISFSAFLMYYGIWSLHNDPEQLAERSTIKPNVKGWDRIIMAIYTVLLFVLLIVAGLDGGRYHWAPASTGLQAAGWIACLLACALVFWTISVNTFLSRYVRIQDDRSQQAITRGPYRWIRHPMYLGVIILMLGVPLCLGSTWALLPGVLIVILYIIRTALEDKTLQAELQGYSEYCLKVRYRLIPGIW